MSSNVDQMSRATSVKGKAVITGASAGIGKVFAERLGKRGYDLILIARRADRLKFMSAELQDEYGISVQTIPADLANSTQLRDVADMIAADESVSLLLNNAGTATLGAFVDLTAVDISAMIDLNIVALTRPDSFGFLKLTEKGVDQDFAEELPDGEKKIIFATQIPASVAALGAPVSQAAWKSKPSWFLVTTRDRVIPVELARTMARRIDAETVEVSSCHAVVLAHPDEVISFILKASLADKISR